MEEHRQQPDDQLSQILADIGIVAGARHREYGFVQAPYDRIPGAMGTFRINMRPQRVAPLLRAKDATVDSWAISPSVIAMVAPDALGKSNSYLR
jgi:hypothetical protein